MTLDKLFNNELFEDYEMQEKYKDCVALYNIFMSKTQKELVQEIIDIWKTWEDEKGKTEFSLKTGIDKSRMHNLITSASTYVKFEDYIRIMAVGKDYVVIEQKYPATEEMNKIMRRVKYSRRKEEDNANN